MTTININHARVLGVAYAVYGLVASLGVLAAGAAVLFTIGMAGALRYAVDYLSPGEHSLWIAGGTLAVQVVIAALILFITAVLTLPSFLTAWGLLKGKRWASTAAFASVVVLLLTSPVGSVFNLALIGYTLWFIFGGAREQVERFVPSYAPPSRSASRS